MNSGNIWDLQKGISEAANHEELLYYRIHIGDSAEVFNTDKAS
jgi:hypothetical protein